MFGFTVLNRDLAHADGVAASARASLAGRTFEDERLDDKFWRD